VCRTPGLDTGRDEHLSQKAQLHPAFTLAMAKQSKKPTSTGSQQWVSQEGKYFEDCQVPQLLAQVTKSEMVPKFKNLADSISEETTLEDYLRDGWVSVHIAESILKMIPAILKKMHSALLASQSQISEPYVLSNDSLQRKLNAMPVFVTSNSLDLHKQIKEHFGNDLPSLTVEAGKLLSFLKEQDRKFQEAKLNLQTVQRAIVPKKGSGDANQEGVPGYKQMSENCNNWKSIEHLTNEAPGDPAYNERLALILTNARLNFPRDEKAFVQGAILGAQALDAYISKLFGRNDSKHVTLKCLLLPLLPL
jgi:hypothetical protein